jgi:two-component system, cell cycle sensor histidine kinase and response regulator CckA
MTLEARRGLDILLVEDSATDRLIAIEALEQSGIVSTLSVVENGVEAMAYLRREGKFAAATRPDLILLDLNLPKKDGREVLMEIKHDASLKLIPVIVLTTSGADEDVVRAYGDHANSYITKPVDFPRFTRALEAIGAYWFEVVTLPREASITRLARQERSRPTIPPPGGQRRFELVLSSKDAALERKLRELLGGVPESHGLQLAADVPALRRALDGVRCDALLVDVRGGGGLEAYRTARAAAPAIAIIVIVDEPDEALAELCLREGAEDYLARADLQAPLLARVLRYATGRQTMRHQLRRAQRMEAMGQLASGVAHDFNNLLTVLSGHAELLAELWEDSAGRESLQGIRDACERAGQLTRQLLNLSQRRVSRLAPLDLNRAVSDFSRLLRRVLGSDVRLALSLSPQPACALADVGMIEQVLLNLAINARDAMGAGGLLTLETGAIELDGGALTHPDAYAGAFATLAVEDTGAGIPPELLGRIWEPFLTTKEAGKGTGLGLSIVLEIVQQHRGWIQVESQPGVGTRFEIFLPRAQVDVDGAGTAGAAAPRRGTERVLLVDDEAPVRQLVRAVLERKGYQVLEARSAQDALACFDEHAGAIDLLLTDVVMPGGMTGPALARELLARAPALAVLLTSGYGAEPEVAAGETLPLLPKPFAPSRLLAAVRSALDAARERAES